jgi:inorganic pyrophosphatase
MDILVYIEISKNTNVKYEYDETLKSLICDRILSTPFNFPFNYGFIPNTLSGDGDPIDAVVYMEQPLIPGSYVKCKIIGCLETEDEKGIDNKLILVPVKKVSPIESNINDVSELPEMFIKKFTYFYQHYKDLENKVVKVGNLLNKDAAIKIYEESIQAYQLVVK